MIENGTYNGNGAATAAAFGKIQPQALLLEEAVLGAILIDREALPAVVDLLKPQSFYAAKHEAIYAACLALYSRNEPVDVLTVGEQLRKDGAAVERMYLVELTNRVASAANIEYHARIIAQKAIGRNLITAASRCISGAYADEEDIFTVLESLQTELFNLENVGGRPAESISAIGMDVLKAAEAAMQIPEGITGVPSGFLAIDKTTGGWQPSDLVIIAGRPGMGKTAFALGAALNAAKAGTPTAVFSLEMSSRQLVNRLVASETGINSTRIMRGQLSADEARKIAECVNKFSEHPLYIDDTPGLNIFDLRAKARRLKLKHGVGLVVVDYLQLMHGNQGRGISREQEVSSISRGLKALAKELDVPVIALSQLSRAVEIRGGSKRPIMSDLRDSGGIEQDADIVAFLYRPEYYGILEDEQGMSLKGVTEFIISKHRNGALNDIGLRFDAALTKFSDLGPQEFRPINDFTFPASSREENAPF